MSLLTGALRSASVIAEQDCDVVVVDRAGFQDVLANDPAVLDALSEQLEANVNRVAAMQAAGAAGEALAPAHGRLREQIRHFFGLK